MHPILFEPGPVTIYSYGVLLAAAYLLGLWIGVRRASQAGLDGNKVLDLGIWVIIAALVGAKGLLFVVDFNHFTSSREEFLSLLRSGGVFYGGLIAASLICIYQLRKHKLPLWQSGDLFAPGIALGYMVGRLGCLAAGCCYGKPTQVAWAITFTDPAAAMNVGTPLGVPLHPTQLYESLAGLVILVDAARHRAPGPPLPGPHVLAVRADVRGVALRHRVLPRRRPRHGVDVLDLAAHLARAGPAQPRHAVVARPARRGRRPRSRRRGHRQPADGLSVTPGWTTHHLRASRPTTTACASTSSWPARSPNHSRSQMQRLIDEGHVALPRVPTPKANTAVREGDAITRRRARAGALGARARGSAAADPLPGRRSGRGQQAGGHGRASRAPATRPARW